MFHIEQPNITRPKLKRAWLFYESHDAQNGDRSVIATVNDIQANPNGQPELGPGRPMEAKDLARTLHRMQGHELLEHHHDGLLDANLLQFDSKKITWFVPGERRQMWIQEVTRDSNQPVQPQVIEVPWPHLIFQVTDQLRIYATANRKRPTVDTLLYHAPLANVFRNANVCLGNATSGDLSLAGRAIWEEAIFESKFSHINHPQTIRPSALNLNEDEPVTTAQHFQYWRSLANGKRSCFPPTALMPLTDMYEQQHLSLGDVLT